MEQLITAADYLDKKTKLGFSEPDSKTNIFKIHSGGNRVDLSYDHMIVYYNVARLTSEVYEDRDEMTIYLKSGTIAKLTLYK